MIIQIIRGEVSAKFVDSSTREDEFNMITITLLDRDKKVFIREQLKLKAVDYAKKFKDI
jgi:hypothetical protein